MKIRKLEPNEHGSTRALWEQVFVEDTKEFLDYYYTCVTKKNDIYVIEEDGAIVSMIHLNPYDMHIGNSIYQTHYIVAVATNERYRRRGYMGKLLSEAMNEMKKYQEPFTFLMPAAESIYAPYGFQTVATQVHYKYDGSINEMGVPQISGYETRYAREQDCEALSVFAEEMFRTKYMIYTVRDQAYFAQLIREQESQHGGVIMVQDGAQLVGYFLLAKEGYLQVREPVSRYSKLDLVERMKLQIIDRPKIMIRPIDEDIYEKCMLDISFEQLCINEIV